MVGHLLNIFMEHDPNDCHKRKLYNFDPDNVFLAIALNILQRLKTGFVLQGHTQKVQTLLWIVSVSALSVQVHSQENRMTAHNLAVIFVVTLFQELAMNPSMVQLTKELILRHTEIFMVRSNTLPTVLMSQKWLCHLSLCAEPCGDG